MGLKGRAATLAAIAVIVVKGIAVAVTASNAMAPADIVVAGQKWDFSYAETVDGVESAVFYPRGQDRDDATHALILKTALEDAPFTMEALKAEVDPSYEDDNFVGYHSRIDAAENTLRIQVYMKDIPGKSFGAVTASMTGLLPGTTEMIFARYTIGISKYDGHERDIPKFLEQADQHIEAVTPQQIHDWFAYRHDAAKEAAERAAKQS